MTSPLFLDRYSVDQQLVEAHSGSSRPEILTARDKEAGSTVTIKRWARRPEIDDRDLAIIWRSEIRILQRLVGYPGGRDYLTSLLEAGHDAAGFYLVLDTGKRVPLPGHNSVNDKLIELPRELLWRNIRRLALGLEILHTNGLIHRNLDAAAVFSALGPDADFQLGGFEWTIVLRGAASEARKKTHGVLENYSFQRDWRDLGALIAQMLGLNLSSASTELYGDRTDGTVVQAEEMQLLRLLHDASTGSSVNGDSVVKLVNRIIRECGASTEAQGEPLELLFEASKDFLWKSVLDGALPDHAALVRLLWNDVETGTLLELDTPKPRAKELALCGRRFTYHLKKYGTDDWMCPALDRIEPQAPHARRILRRQPLPGGALKIIDAFRGRHPMNSDGRGPPWDSVFEDIRDDQYSAGARVRYDAFVVLHLIELLEQEANTWRIVIQECERWEGGRYRYTVTYVEESNLKQQLSEALGLNAPLQRLLETLEREGDADSWRVVPASGRWTEETDYWTYVGCDDKHIEKRIQFLGSKYFPGGEALFLSEAEDEGQEKLMRRRGQLLSALKEHAALTELLSSPLLFARDSYEAEQPVRPGLDHSKRAALTQISRVLPMYLLQGPPGVGKTYLVNELVRGQLSADPMVKLLISAQGHDALNHLMWDLCGDLASQEQTNPPLIVRSKSRQERDAPPGFRMREQAMKLVSNVIGSPAFERVPEALREQLHALRRRVQEAEDNRITDRALESLLLRSANLVFSTCNSADLKSMVDAQLQFDWSIVEEAGRATGTELLSPLMLSHRRLLIGDPQQLPPFGEEKVKALLKPAEKLKKALALGRPLLQRSYYGIDIDELIERYASTENLQRVAVEVEKTLLLFEHLHRDTFRRGNLALPMAGRLEEQYRMHPAIADLVSETFYDGALGTAEQTRAKRQAEYCPFEIVDAKSFLSSPIVVIDMPWSQKSSDRRVSERTPAYHNLAEEDAVVEILSALRPLAYVKKKPSLAVLTPYNEQVKRISRRVAMERSHRLAHLDGFDLPKDYVHTIDSFQGDEADIVVVSLVRNNGRSWRKGLGILGDARRMNVMLSRARWKLVIVGSLEFLQRRFPPLVPVIKGDTLYFLRRLNRAFAVDRHRPRWRRRGGITVVPFEKLVGARKL